MFKLKLVREELEKAKKNTQVALSCVFILEDFSLRKVLIENSLREEMKENIIKKFIYLTNNKEMTEYDPIVKLDDLIDNIDIEEVPKLKEIKSSLDNIDSIQLVNNFKEIENSRAYVIIMTNVDDNKRYFFFKKIFSSLYLKSKLKVLFNEGRLKQIKEDIITQLYFEQIFNYQDEYTKKCNENINKIRQLNIIKNIEDIEKESEKVTIKKKLAKIKDSDINWFKDKVNNSLNDIQNIISSVGLDMKIENGEIISNDTSELIHLIQDDYLKSNLSGDDYVTDKKTKIKKC